MQKSKSAFWKNLIFPSLAQLPYWSMKIFEFESHFRPVQKRRGTYNNAL